MRAVLRSVSSLVLGVLLLSNVLVPCVCPRGRAEGDHCGAPSPSARTLSNCCCDPAPRVDLRVLSRSGSDRALLVLREKAEGEGAKPALAPGLGGPSHPLHRLPPAAVSVLRL
jgi:hypothetical protein